MKFERLTVPDWPLPDLVAFNERVRGVLDPWWQRVWVKGSHRLGVIAALFVLMFSGLMWMLFRKRSLPSSQTLLAYQAAASDQRPGL